MYTDSHCHVTMSREGEASLTAAREAGVCGFVVPGTCLDDAEDVVALATKHEDVWAAVGFHPHEAKRYDDEARRKIRELSNEERVVAIGEVGLDYHYDHSPRETQKDVLREHIGLALELDLPVIIHNRESTDDLLKILEEEVSSGVRGVIHSFTETADVARRFVDLGFLISFSGILTFKSADSLRAAAKVVPLDRLLVETDTPYLAPVPHRGKENQPAFVTHVVEALANLRNMTVEEVGRITSSNFESLFHAKLKG